MKKIVSVLYKLKTAMINLLRLFKIPFLYILPIFLIKKKLLYIFSRLFKFNVLRKKSFPCHRNKNFASLFT